MKKYNKTFFVSVIFVLLVQITWALPAVEKAKAKVTLMKTNRAIGVAHMVIKKTRSFSGLLGKSVKHERFAKKLYNEGKYDRAVYHSLKARQYAGEIMKASNAKTTSDFLLSADEKQWADSSPSDQELEDEVNKDNPAVIKDEDLMNGSLDLDVL